MFLDRWRRAKCTAAFLCDAFCVIISYLFICSPCATSVIQVQLTRVRYQHLLKIISNSVLFLFVCGCLHHTFLIFVFNAQTRRSTRLSDALCAESCHFHTDRQMWVCSSSPFVCLWLLLLFYCRMYYHYLKSQQGYTMIV